MNIDLKFRNPEQEKFYWSRMRNNEFDGAFANGKSWAGCARLFTHLMTFPNYAGAVCRQEYKVLRQTTLKTFMKICKPELILKHDENAGFTIFINKSFVYWMHLDTCDEQDLRGLEINSVLIDQAEEIAEPIYSVLDARVGRWDQAIVPSWLLRSQLTGEDFETSKKIEKDAPKTLDSFIRDNTHWPRHEKWGHFLVPNYMDVLCNVADDEEFHWTYRYYNPASLERKPDHSYVHREMDESLNDARTYQQMLLRDQEWVDKYVLGKRGAGGATIHHMHALSIIEAKDYSKEQFDTLISLIKLKGALYRILDHGGTGTTAVLWLAMLAGIHIFYKEYYANRKLISENRKNIHEWSQGEEYVDNFADPSIFKKTQQMITGTKSGFWTTALEYSDIDEIDPGIYPPIDWTAADNNEFATRNRINELLLLNPKYSHPITKVTPAPGIYFIKRSPEYPLGVQEGITQLKVQRRLLLGEDNGKKLYSEERDENVPDHSYDCVRYGVAMHNTNKAETKKTPKRMSFEYYNQMLKRRPKFTPASY